MGTAFNLTNDGTLPVYDIETECGIDSAISTGGAFVSGISFTFPTSKAPVLSPGHKMDLPCDKAVMLNNPKSASVTIFVRYRPAWRWWATEEQFPMQAQESEDGTWLWRSTPQ